VAQLGERILRKD